MDGFSLDSFYKVPTALVSKPSSSNDSVASFPAASALLPLRFLIHVLVPLACEFMVSIDT